MEQYVKEETEIAEKRLVERRSTLDCKTMHEVINRKSTPFSKIKGSSKIERIQIWNNHFTNFLGKGDPDALVLSTIFFNHKLSDPFSINTRKVMLELQTCSAKMSKQKPSGPDNIPTRLWKDHNFHIERLFFCMKH